MIKNIPLYKSLINDIKISIDNGKYKPGDKIPTEYELAGLYGVSRITVVRATKELENEGLVYKVKGTGTFIKDPNVKTLVNNDFKFIPVILPFKEKWLYDILCGAEDELKKRGFYTSYICTNNNPSEERELILNLLEKNACGFIVYPLTSFSNLDLFSSMLIRNIPFVFVDRTSEVLEIPYVTSNNLEATYNLTNLIIGYGHSKIACVGQSIRLFGTSYDRYKGYCKALVDNGIEINSNYIFDNFSLEENDFELTDTSNNELFYNSALRIIKELFSLKTPPTAIVAINDIIAAHLIKAAIALGISVPDQLSISGFDNLLFNDQPPVSLTTVNQHFNKMGSIAAKMLLSKIDKPSKTPKNQIIGTEIIIRDSIKNLKEQ